MSSFAVLTAIGPDRPGLVDEVSAYLAGQNINIEDSRMAVLGGEFAIILLASGEKDVGEELIKLKPKIEKTTNLDIQVKPTIAPDHRKIKPSIPHRIHVTSLDHPGLVHDITKMLHGYEINIESLDTHVSSAPISGTPIFTMTCTVNVPVEKKIAEIKESLSELEYELNVDIDFVAIDPV